MARSHVKELVRQAFEMDEVVVDEDGDLPFPCGVAMFYASVARGGRVLRVWSRAVCGIKVDKAVLRELDEVNGGLLFSRVFSRGDGVWVEGCLPLETLRVAELRALFHEVGTTADNVGSMLAAVHGGTLAFPHGADVDTSCDD